MVDRSGRKKKPERWPIVAGEGSALRMTLAEWSAKHQIRSLRDEECKWMGHVMEKSPLDLWIYQEIFYELKPERVVEIGSLYGGSTIYFANLLDLIGGGLVISVDIDRSPFKAKHERIVTVTGDSSSGPIVSRVSELCRDKTTIVIHDGNHSRQQVLKDMRAYAPIVSPGSYLIVEDGIVDQFLPGAAHGWFCDFPDGGPLPAIRQFLKENKDFEVDASRERYILTQNPEGYLKRIR